MTVASLDELERLVLAMTPGPFATLTESYDRRRVQVIDLPTSCSIIDTANDGCASDPMPTEHFFSPENAAGIVSLRNNALALIAAARDAERMREALEPFAGIGIPDTWPGFVVLTWEASPRGYAFINYLSANVESESAPKVEDYRRAAAALAGAASSPAEPPTVKE